MQILPEQVMQESSAKVTCAFKDASDGTAVTPLTVTWTLMTLDGTLIDSRTFPVSVTPASTVEIWLSADDLQMLDETKEYELRRILIQATYNNGTSTVPIKDQGQFAIFNLPGVTS